MFQKFLTFIRDWLENMIKKSDLKTAFDIDVNISSDMLTALEKWGLIYKNESPWLSSDIKSLNLGAAIAGEVARSVTIEMGVEVTGSARADFINSQIEPVIDSLRAQVEFGTAKGGLIMKPYIDGEKIAVDFIQADMFYPVSFDGSGRITSCVFSAQTTRGKYFYTRLEYHALNGRLYEVRNTAFRSDNSSSLGNPIPLTEVPEWEDLEPEATISGVDAPLFGYFKYPLANSIDPTSPLGVSVYSRAVEQIEQADSIWSGLVWEFESGKRAIYVDELTLNEDSEGKFKLGDKRLYRAIPGQSNIGDMKKLFESWTPEFRDESYRNGFNAVLRRIEYNCGLAYGTLSNQDVQVLTAEEIKTSKQRSAATIKDAQKALERALNDLFYAMDVWADISTLAPSGAYEAVFDFDDSLIVDADTQMINDRQDVTAGLMTRWEYRVNNYGESEEQAKEKIAEIDAEKASSGVSYFEQ